jgi:hypothetical protein
MAALLSVLPRLLFLLPLGAKLGRAVVDVSLSLRLRAPDADPPGEPTCTNEDELYRGSDVGGSIGGCDVCAFRRFGELEYSIICDELLAIQR